MTRHQQEMYRNIERIAVALETLVIEAKDQKIDTFRKATNIIYGNNNKGRSSDNYQYPSKSKDNKLDDRIYQESQTITGGEFQDWYHALQPEELESYRRVYGH